MLSRSATILMAAGALTATSAQQVPYKFLESVHQPTLYPTLKNSMMTAVTEAKNDFGFDFTPEAHLRDIQNKCQYMAGLNFYDLQPIAIA